jgi:hypothetical protein
MALPRIYINTLTQVPHNASLHIGLLLGKYNMGVIVVNTTNSQVVFISAINSTEVLGAAILQQLLQPLQSIQATKVNIALADARLMLLPNAIQYTHQQQLTTLFKQYYDILADEVVLSQSLPNLKANIIFAAKQATLQQLSSIYANSTIFNIARATISNQLSTLPNNTIYITFYQQMASIACYGQQQLLVHQYFTFDNYLDCVVKIQQCVDELITRNPTIYIAGTDAEAGIQYCSKYYAKVQHTPLPNQIIHSTALSTQQHALFYPLYCLIKL